MRISDWSSDVCSSDLLRDVAGRLGGKLTHPIPPHREMGRGTGRRLVEGNGARPPNFPSTTRFASGPPPHASLREELMRSEERRVGKSVSVRVDTGGRRVIKKKQNILLIKNDM